MALLWNEPVHAPLATFPSDPSDAAPGVAALYALFAVHANDIPKAQAALGVAAIPTLLDPYETLNLPWYASPAEWVLAQQAVKGLNPRLDALVTSTLKEGSKAASLPLDHALTLVIAEGPQKTFGIRPLPSLLDATDLGTSPSARRIQAGRVLDRMFAETVGALFATYPDQAAADQLWMRLAQIRELQGRLDGVLGPEDVASLGMNRLPRERLERTIQELIHACSLGNVLTQRLERYTGLGCEPIAANARALVVARGIDPDRLGAMHSLNLLPGNQEQAASWRAIHSEASDPSANEGLWTKLQDSMPPAFGHAPITVEIRSIVRNRLRQAVLTYWSETPAGPTVHERQGLDLIAAFHPESPMRFLRTSLELWSAHNQGRPLSFEFRGQRSAAPVLSLSGPAMRNRRTLRQFINTFADGRLPQAADTAGIPQSLRHTVFAQGLMTKEMAQSLTESHGLSAEHEALWLQRFHLSNEATVTSGHTLNTLALHAPAHRRPPRHRNPPLLTSHGAKTPFSKAPLFSRSGATMAWVRPTESGKRNSGRRLRNPSSFLCPTPGHRPRMGTNPHSRYEVPSTFSVSYGPA